MHLCDWKGHTVRITPARWERRIRCPPRCRSRLSCVNILWYCIATEYPCRCQALSVINSDPLSPGLANLNTTSVPLHSIDAPALRVEGWSGGMFSCDDTTSFVLRRTGLAIRFLLIWIYYEPWSTPERMRLTRACPLKTPGFVR